MCCAIVGCHPKASYGRSPHIFAERLSETIRETTRETTEKTISETTVKTTRKTIKETSREALRDTIKSGETIKAIPGSRLRNSRLAGRNWQTFRLNPLV